jgi:hypothetical protein
VFGVAPGAFAEYACNGESKLKPANVSFGKQAVPVAAFTALQVPRQDRFSRGKRFSLTGRLAA